MPLAPETAVSPVAQAPPDRPTLTIEDWTRQGMALLFADNKLDQNERQVLYTFFAQVQQRALNGGIGQGATPPAGAPMDAGMQQSPMDMNSNTEDLGTAEGAQPEDDSEGY